MSRQFNPAHGRYLHVLKSLRECLFILMQRLLPARLLARGIYAVTRSRQPWVKDALIRGFVRLYAVDVDEAAAPVPGGYESFNAFFTRSLRPGTRPPDPDPATIVSPADGVIQQIGYLNGEDILQVKGSHYGASELLGDPAVAAQLRGGAFATIYLAPWNYHRVHMPVTGRVRRMSYIPGELWSVNATTAARVPRLFARNERLVCLCEAAWGRFAVVLVGALNVGSISTAWAGEILPRRTREARHWDYAAPGAIPELARGDLLGQFNMGSTVIVLLPPGAAVWRDDLGAGGALRVGQSLGRLAVSEARGP